MYFTMALSILIMAEGYWNDLFSDRTTLKDRSIFHGNMLVLGGIEFDSLGTNRQFTHKIFSVSSVQQDPIIGMEEVTQQI